MARIRFKKPKIAVLMGEIISLTVWLFLGDKVITVLNTLIGDPNRDNATSALGNITGSHFKDGFEILGLGCTDTGVKDTCASNTDNGLLGVIALIMVVMVLMNFVSYN